MDGRHARLVDPALRRVPSLERTEPAAPRAVRAAPARVLSTAWAAALGIGWPLAFFVAVALQPEPAHSEATPSVLASTAVLAFMLALWTTVLLAAERNAAAGFAGSITGVIVVADTVACPASGHHQLGLWWFGQLALMTTMLAVSLIAALRHRAPRPT